MNLPCQGQGLFEAGQDVGWDQWRFAAPAYHQFSTFPDGGPALEASWSHPTWKKPIGLFQMPPKVVSPAEICYPPKFIADSRTLCPVLRLRGKA